jgi:hypothetical protein
VLLPVWIMAYRFRDRVFRFLVNGQTGKATGEAPISYAKILGAILIAALVVALILLLAGGLKGETTSSSSRSTQERVVKMVESNLTWSAGVSPAAMRPRWPRSVEQNDQRLSFIFSTTKSNAALLSS